MILYTLRKLCQKQHFKYKKNILCPNKIFFLVDKICPFVLDGRMLSFYRNNSIYIIKYLFFMEINFNIYLIYSSKKTTQILKMKIF